MMMLVRLWHHYIGFLIAPSVLFFALTGSVQLFGLHEAHGGYRPPVLIEKLASVHKDQVFRAKPPRPPPPQTSAAGPTATQRAIRPERERGPKLNTILLKFWFLAVALGLVVSTCLGLWIGFNHVRRRKTALILFAIGAVVPVALLLI